MIYHYYSMNSLFINLNQIIQLYIIARQNRSSSWSSTFIRRISGCACCSSSSSCSYIIRFDSASWRTSKSSSIWPESGLKRRSPGSKKHMLIRSIDVRIRTRRTPFWSSSVLAEAQLQKTHEQKFEEMERDRGPIRSRANNQNTWTSSYFCSVSLLY